MISPDLHNKENVLDYGNKNVVRAISQGLKQRKVSSADLVTMTLLSSAKKRRLTNTAAPQEIASTFHKTKFDLRKGGSMKDQVDDSTLHVTYDEEHLDDSPITEMKRDHSSESINSHHSYSSSQYDQDNIMINNQFHSDNDENISIENTQSTINNSIATTQPSLLPLNSQPPITTTISISISMTDQLKLLRQKAGQAVIYQILHILNHGNLDELMELRYIGKTRANAIMELRMDKNFIFKSCYDLQEIYMSDNMIKKFVKYNLTYFINLELI